MIGTEDGVEALRRRLHAWVLHGAERAQGPRGAVRPVRGHRRVESGDCVGSLL
ncbi:MAG: hypothetical protein R3F30_14395 [Planctomycetota bacterium]